MDAVLSQLNSVHVLTPYFFKSVIIIIIIIIIIFIMALQSFDGPWPIFQFLDPIRSR
jgi:hypothetical protein